MLISIGKGPKPAADITDALLECHERIRSFTRLTLTLASRPELPESEVLDVAARIERYFQVALPLHVRDEEESLLPRLRGLEPAVDDALARMHAEHLEHGAVLQRLFAALADVKAAPLDTKARATLLDAGNALSAAFEPHLVTEEDVIFPALRRRLDASTRQAMLDELRARRG